MAEKKKGIFRKTLGKIRKKIAPTFGEQHEEARKAGKKTFRSTRHKKKGSGWTGETLGKLEYHTRTKEDEAKAEKKHTARERARSGDKSKQLSDRGAKFKLPKKMGKDSFTHKGKKYSTLLKGEKKKKPLISGKGFFGKKLNIPKVELSGGTAKKIKTFVGAQAGGRIAGAARRAQEHGWYSPDMGMRGRGYAKGGLIKGKPKLAVKGW